jgi:hypothetical protein
MVRDGLRRQRWQGWMTGFEHSDRGRQWNNRDAQVRKLAPFSSPASCSTVGSTNYGGIAQSRLVGDHIVIGQSREPGSSYLDRLERRAGPPAS